MEISYNNLWKILIDKRMTKSELRIKCNISSATMAKMTKNQSISMDTIIKICEVLDCNIEDILSINKEV